MPSLSSQLVTGLLIVTRYRHRLDSPSKVERYVREHTVRPAPYAPPRRLDRKVAFSVDTRHGWTCYTVVPRNSPTPTQQVLYVHGGGHIGEIISAHWSLIAKLANKGPAEVTVPIYPLAPHSTASQTVPVATDIAADLIARNGAQNVTLIGDSAGGNIVLGIAQTLRRRGLPQPRQLVLISPGLDASKSNPAIASVAPYDRVLSVAGSTASTQLYIGKLESKDPLVSPLYADLSGLAPMLVFSGTHDIHNPDACDFAARARDAGVSVDYHEQPGAQHVYPLLPTAEGASARTLITALVGSAAVGETRASRQDETVQQSPPRQRREAHSQGGCLEVEDALSVFPADLCAVVVAEQRVVEPFDGVGHALVGLSVGRSDVFPTVSHGGFRGG